MKRKILGNFWNMVVVKALYQELYVFKHISTVFPSYHLTRICPSFILKVNKRFPCVHVCLSSFLFLSLSLSLSLCLSTARLPKSIAYTFCLHFFTSHSLPQPTAIWLLPPLYQKSAGGGHLAPHRCQLRWTVSSSFCISSP